MKRLLVTILAVLMLATVTLPGVSAVDDSEDTEDSSTCYGVWVETRWGKVCVGICDGCYNLVGQIRTTA